MKLILQGEVRSIQEKEFEGKVTRKLQFLIDDEEKGLKIVSVKLDEKQDVSIIKKGSNVMLEVRVSTMKDSFEVFYSQNGELKVK